MGSEYAEYMQGCTGREYAVEPFVIVIKQKGPSSSHRESDDLPMLWNIYDVVKVAMSIASSIANLYSM